MKTGLRIRPIALLALLMAVVTSPVWALTQNEIQKLLASDGAAGDTFGRSVAFVGDIAVIGAPNDDDDGFNSGAAYVFTRSAGVWTEQQKLTASDAVANDRFGSAVAVDGTTAVIGAAGLFFADDNTGSAYVFTRSAGVWTEQQKLIAGDGANRDQFGFSVAMDGDTAVIGARNDDDNGADSGSAYVFTHNAGVWTEQQKLLASDGATRDRFGLKVAVDGDTALISGQGNDDNGTGSGSAYVFVRSAGVWTEQQKLIASDGSASDLFGVGLSVEGDTAVIGARFDDDNARNSGSAYVFTRSAGVWSQQQKLTASDGAEHDRFGFSVPVDGDTAVISSFYDDDNGVNSGSDYVFTRSAGMKLLASDGATGDVFSLPIAFDGNTVMIAALFDDDLGTDSGSVYVFSLVTDEEPPLVTNVLANPNPIAVNTPLTLTATVDDSATGNSAVISATYTNNGGAPVAMTAQDGAFDSSTEAVVAMLAGFASAGIHEMCATGTDAADNTSEPACTLLAVYDPDAGFVTGGGWIDSPANACRLTTACQDLAGRANFGFVSMYKKGAQTPTGNTEFRFQAGDLNFHSDNYEWLVIAGHRAQYKGSGTINDAGNYGFMLFAIDENLTPSTDVDLFRIKIWDMDNGDMVVYDNEIGAADDAAATTTISGGSIMIHTKGKK